MITASDPHKRMDRISAQTALLVVGNVGCGGGQGGGAGNLFMNGEALPNKRKGRLNKSNTRVTINCPIKKSTLSRKPTNVPTREKKPRLSPAGNRLTIIARIKRKNRL